MQGNAEQCMTVYDSAGQCKAIVQGRAGQGSAGQGTGHVQAGHCRAIGTPVLNSSMNARI